MSEPKKQSPMMAIFFTVFLDMLGLGIVIPIMAPLLLNPMNTILPQAASVHTRTILLGFLIAAYPLAQFIGAPILGALSDRHGRKKMLLISLLGTMVGYVLFAISIVTNNILLLFVSRILDGFTGGNISIAYSAISDVSDAKTKARNFGMVGAAFGLGFILGPYIGGRLSDASLVSWFDMATPFWFAAILSALNILMLMTAFKETLKTKIQTPVSLFTGVKNIKKAFEYKELRAVFLVVFLMTLGFNFFTQFFQVFLIDKFNFTVSNISDMFAYIGIWIVIGQGGVLRPLAKRMKALEILRFAAILLAIAFPFLLLPHESKYLYYILPFVAIFQGLTQPNVNAVVSDQVGREEQGQILGINQSIRSLGMAIPPIVAAYINLLNINYPIITAAICIGLGWLVLVGNYSKLHAKEESEKKFST